MAKGKPHRWGVQNDLNGRDHVSLSDGRTFTVEVPRRLYINTPWGSLIIGSRTQLWLPWRTRVPWADELNERAVKSGKPPVCPDGKSNNSRWWSPITWHPWSKER